MQDIKQAGHIKKILIFEDDSDYRKLLKTYLSKDLQGVELVEYDPVSKGAPPDNFDWSTYDVLILDYYLCIYGLTGLDLLQKHRKKPGFPATIMITGAGDEEVAARALNFGIYDYLRKEKLNREELIESVNNAFKKHQGEQVKHKEQEKASNAFDKTRFYRELENPSDSDIAGRERVLLVIDVDNMDALTAEFGIIVHDNLLRHLAKSSYDKLSPSFNDLYITRLGDSSIVILVQDAGTGINLEKEVLDLYEHYQDKSYVFSGKTVSCTVSIGALLIDQERQSTASLIKAAVHALDIARKTQGRFSHILSLKEFQEERQRSIDEQKQREQEEKQKEEEHKRQLETQRREDEKRRKEEHQKLEEERQRLAEEKHKLEAAEKQRLEALKQREEEEKRKEEEEKQKIEEERRLLEEERQRLAEEKRKLEEEEQKRLLELQQREAEEKHKEKEERKKMEEERKQLEAERLRLAEEKHKLEVEEKKRLEELQKREIEEKRKEEEERRKLEEERLRLAEEKRKLEEEEKKRSEVLQKRKAEDKRKEIEKQRKLEEERLQLENERKQLEEEKRRRAEEEERLRIIEAERKRKEEEERLQQLEIERQRKEEEARRKAEADRKHREEQQRLLAEKKEKLRLAEEERKRKEEKLRQMEEQNRKAEELRRKEKAAKLKEEHQHMEEERKRKTEKEKKLRLAKEEQQQQIQKNKTSEQETAPSDKDILSFPLDVSIPAEAGLSLDTMAEQAAEKHGKKIEKTESEKPPEKAREVQKQEKPAAAPGNEVVVNESELDAQALAIKQAFNENRAVQTFQPVVPMFTPESGNTTTLYKVDVQVIESNGSITTADEIKSKNTDISLQQFIDRWILREIIGRIVNNLDLQSGKLFIITISEAWLTDITLFNWLQTVLTGLENIRPGKCIALELPASMLVEHKKRATALIKALKKSYGFMIALDGIESVEDVSSLSGLLEFNLFTINYGLAEEFQNSAEKNADFMETLKKRDVHLVVDGIEDSTMLTNAISQGADYVMGSFIGGPETYIADTSNVESFDII